MGRCRSACWGLSRAACLPADPAHLERWALRWIRHGTGHARFLAEGGPPQLVVSALTEVLGSALLAAGACAQPRPWPADSPRLRVPSEGTGGVLAAWPPRCPRQAVPAKRRVTLSRSSPSQEPLFPATHRDLITLPALFCVTARAVAFCHQKLTWAYIRPAKMTQTGLRLEVPPRGTVAQVIPTAAPSYLPSIHPSTCTFAHLRAHLPTRPPAIHPPRTSRHLPAYPSTYPPPICPFTRFSALYLPLRPLTFLLCAQTRFQTRY